MSNNEKWFPQEQPDIDIDPDAFRMDERPLEIFEDFLGESTSGVLGWVQAGTGASLQMVSAAVTAATRALGVLEIDSGSTATGRAAFRNSTIMGILFGSAKLAFMARFAVATAKPTAAEAYQAQFGFGDQFDNGLGTTDATNGAYFHISEASPYVVCKTADNGVRNSITTNVIIPPVGEFHRYGIVVDEDGLTVRFSIDDVLVATSKASIPVAAGRQTGFGAKLQKTNGTTLRAIWFDYVWFKAHYSAAR